jgi:hypothetical protein
MPSNPDICSCGSQLFTAVWAVTAQDGVAHSELDPKQGNTAKLRVGFRCVECGATQLTRKVPERHARDTNLSLPDSADTDISQ